MLTRPMPIVSRLMIMIIMIMMLVISMLMMMIVWTVFMFMRMMKRLVMVWEMLLIMFHLGKLSRSGAPGLCPGRATWRNTARFATFVLIVIMRF